MKKQHHISIFIKKKKKKECREAAEIILFPDDGKLSDLAWFAYADIFKIEKKKKKFLIVKSGSPGGKSGKEPTCPYRRHKRCGFDPWVKKIPWRAAHFSILVWRIPGTEKPDKLQSTESQRVRHD